MTDGETQNKTTRFQLADHTVHIWRLHLGEMASQAADYRALLHSAERERADRYVSPDLQTRFILTRGVLRRLCGAYLKLPPADLDFTYNAYGKPALATKGLHFNLSHSGVWAVYAFSRMPPVGIDIEQIRQLTDVPALASRYFAPGEVRRLARLDSAQQTGAFFRLWTRKEAYVKAEGRGLTLSLKSFEVSLEPEAETRLYSQQYRTFCALRNVEVAPGYVGCVALNAAVHRSEIDNYPASP